MWADAVPNLLIGLREGLEAGLVVSILLAALKKVNAAAEQASAEQASAGQASAEQASGTDEPAPRRISSAAVWLGVLGAVMLAGSFAAVLTFSTDALSSSTQEAVGGLLSVIAVGLVTWMVFWMRRTARTLSAQLRGEVAKAAAIGAGALTVTAFLAVGREGLETTLFIWTAVKASGSTVAPLLGAAIGLIIAIVLCALLYRQAVRINLGTFFNRTAIALIVIAAGVFSYGLGDLQDAGLLPGGQWVAFDLTAHVDPNAWWVSIVSGVTELAPRMTVLQVVAWLAYLLVVIPAFVTAGRTAAAPSPSPAQTTAQPAAIQPTVAAPAQPAMSRWERLTARRTWPVAAALVGVPVIIAGVIIAALPTSTASAMTAVSVTSSNCANEWSNGHTGAQTFQVNNKTSKAGEINLLDAAGAVVAEIETIGPATTAQMTANLAPGQYTFACLMGSTTMHGKTVQVSGKSTGKTTAGVKPVTVADLTGPNNQYQDYAAGVLTTLAKDVATLRSAIAAGDMSAAKRDWLTAQLDWEHVGASYDSFGDVGLAIDGLPDGLPQGVEDPNFTGLHRIEYGLYHGQSKAQLLPAADRLAAEVATVRKNLRTDDEAGDPTNLPLRVHEILEDALRDHLSGVDDQGSGMAYALTYADTEVTRTVLAEVTQLVTERDRSLVPTATAQLDTLQSALLATRANGQWQPTSKVSFAARQRVNAAIGALLETLSIEPNLLEVPPTH